MRHTLLLLSFLFFSSYLFANPADKILGIYFVEKKDAKVKFYKKKGKYYAKTIWLKKGTSRIDTKNPNKKLRTRKIIGTTFIYGLEYKNNKWGNGKIYSPREGVHVKGAFELLPNGDLLLKARYLFISQERTWQRIK